LSEFFKRADDSLYLAKERGRNKVVSESQLDSAAA
jgi:PleD family two-component response regulator